MTVVYTHNEFLEVLIFNYLQKWKVASMQKHVVSLGPISPEQLRI